MSRLSVFRQRDINLARAASLGWCPDFIQMDTSLQGEGSGGSQHPHPRKRSSRSEPWTRSGCPRGSEGTQTPPPGQGAPDSLLTPGCRSCDATVQGKTQGPSIQWSLPFQISKVSERNSVGCTQTRPASARANRDVNHLQMI